MSYRSYARTLCAEFNAHALDIVRTQGIDTVIISGRWTDMRQRGLGQIDTTLEALNATGVKVILIGQSPQFVEDVQVIAFLQGSQNPNAINRWGVFFNPAINTQLAAIAGRDCFINPMQALCDGAECTYQDKGVYLFEDYGHFSAAGSRGAVRDLLLTANGASGLSGSAAPSQCLK